MLITLELNSHIITQTYRYSKTLFESAHLQKEETIT